MLRGARPERRCANGRGARGLTDAKSVSSENGGTSRSTAARLRRVDRTCGTTARCAAPTRRRAARGRQAEGDRGDAAGGGLNGTSSGLDAAAAAAVRSEIKTGGVVVDIEDDDDMAKKKTRKLPPKLETLRNTPIKSRAIAA